MESHKDLFYVPLYKHFTVDSDCETEGKKKNLDETKRLGGSARGRLELKMVMINW